MPLSCFKGNAMTTTHLVSGNLALTMLSSYELFPIRGKTHQEITDSHFLKEKQLHPQVTHV